MWSEHSSGEDEVKMISTLPEAPRYHWARLVPDGHHALAETEPEKADEADKEQN